MNVLVENIFNTIKAIKSQEESLINLKLKYSNQLRSISAYLHLGMPLVQDTNFLITPIECLFITSPQKSILKTYNGICNGVQISQDEQAHKKFIDDMDTILLRNIIQNNEEDKIKFINEVSALIKNKTVRKSGSTYNILPFDYYNHLGQYDADEIEILNVEYDNKRMLVSYQSIERNSKMSPESGNNFHILIDIQDLEKFLSTIYYSQRSS